MQTKYWNVYQQTDEVINKYIHEAQTLLKQGETVAFPTETVYGLGADATNEAAVAKIFQAKGRPQDNPLIAHVATKQQLVDIVDNYREYVDKLIHTFSPGPITYVLPSNGICASNVTAGLSTIGVRIPNHPIARKLLKTVNIPIAAPSANTSGKPSPTTAQHVWEDLHGKISGILDGGPTGVGVESTVIDCTGEIPIILRPGGVTIEQLEEVVGTVIFNSSFQNKKEIPKAPGMKYKHYSPEVPLWIVNQSIHDMQTMINQEQHKGKKVGVIIRTKYVSVIQAEKIIDVGNELSDIATNLYGALRTFKQNDVDLIICETFPETGIGQAIMNRLRKAASKIF